MAPWPSPDRKYQTFCFSERCQYLYKTELWHRRCWYCWSSLACRRHSHHRSAGRLQAPHSVPPSPGLILRQCYIHTQLKTTILTGRSPPHYLWSLPHYLRSLTDYLRSVPHYLRFLPHYLRSPPHDWSWSLEQLWLQYPWPSKPKLLAAVLSYSMVVLLSSEEDLEFKLVRIVLWGGVEGIKNIKFFLLPPWNHLGFLYSRWFRKCSIKKIN